MWKQWINAILGLVAIVGAFMGLTGWALAIVGAVILILALWTVSEVPSAEYERVAHHKHA